MVEHKEALVYASKMWMEKHKVESQESVKQKKV